MLSLLVIIVLINYCFMFERQNSWLRAKNMGKPIIDFIFLLLLTGLSIIGCIYIPDNYFSYFLIVYIAAYFFIKEVYTKVIIERRQNVFQITMQKVVETEYQFEKIFIQVGSEKEKTALKTLFKMNENIRRNSWISEYEKGVVGISFDKQRYFFKLSDTVFAEGLRYIIAQIEFNAKLINNLDELKAFKVKVIDNNEIAKNLACNFIPYDSKHEKLKMPSVYGETLFNLTMISGFIFGAILINLLQFWTSTPLLEKIMCIFFGIMFLLSFICGLIVLASIFIDTIGNRKSYTEKISEKMSELEKEQKELEKKQVQLMVELEKIKAKEAELTMNEK